MGGCVCHPNTQDLKRNGYECVGPGETVVALHSSSNPFI